MQLGTMSLEPRNAAGSFDGFIMESDEKAADAHWSAQYTATSTRNNWALEAPAMDLACLEFV
jgi:hypothetical protein